MPATSMPIDLSRRQVVMRDVVASVVVFLVALPLCLGIARASNAEPISGLVAGIVGGLIVGSLSRSHTSVSGPGNSLMFVIAGQIASLGSFESFLTAVVLAGFFQIGLGMIRAGFIAAYFPVSVIRGLLTAIGVILVLKQIPHLIGRDADPEGELAFLQVDHENTLTELIVGLTRLHPGATLIGLTSLTLLILWERVRWLKSSLIPAPFVVIVLGGLLVEGLAAWTAPGLRWHIGRHHLVEVPTASSLGEFAGLLHRPDFAALQRGAVWIAAMTITVVATLETLLNLEAVDKIDPRRRYSPPSRELFAQGVGNVVAGLLGGIPITSVIVRSSININAGAVTKLSAILHGAWLLVFAALLPGVLNRIPLAALAAILLMTGFKLASPKIVMAMWREGWNRFLPYVITVVAIVTTDLLVGVIIGLVVSLAFILHSNLHRPLRHIVEQHAAGDVHRFELASQVSFLNRAMLDAALRHVPRGGQVLLDARNTVYMDPDVTDFLLEYRDVVAPARGVSVSLIGFQDHPTIDDQIEYVDFVSRDLQQRITPPQVVELLKRGNQRFREGRSLTRHNVRQVANTSTGQFPLAAILSCIDSRTPTEVIFDLGLGDVFTVRIAGNVISDRVLGSLEYACGVAGAKAVVVLGHSRCGAVGAAIEFLSRRTTAMAETGCQHIDSITGEIQRAIDDLLLEEWTAATGDGREELAGLISRRNVVQVVEALRRQSETLNRLEQEGKIVLLGAWYDLTNGSIIWPEDDETLQATVLEPATTGAGVRNGA